MKFRLIFLLCLFTSIGYSQNYSFVAYSNSQGLPQSQVQCITQDHLGYLWVGTLGGLAKFNGKKFTTFPIESGLFNNRISCLQSIGETIWVGHEGGITQIIKGKAKKWTLLPEDRNSNITDIVCFKNSIVAATQGGGLYVLRNGHLAKMKLKNDDASTCRDLQIIGNKLYIGTRDGLYCTTDLNAFNHVDSFKSRSISGIACVQNQIYISTFYNGLFQTNTSFNQFDSIPVKPSDFYLGGIQSDRNGNLWISSFDGLIRWSGKNNQLVITEKTGLPINSINCTFEDSEGNIWLGTEGKGLLRFSGEELVQFSEKSGFPSDLVLSAIKQNEDSYIFGTYDRGAFQSDSKGVCKPIAIPGLAIWSIEKEGNNLWFGTDEGLVRKSVNGTIQTYQFGNNTSTFRLVKKLTNGKIFVAGDEGIGWVENETLKRFPASTQVQTGTVRDAIIYNGKLICAGSKGLFESNKNAIRLLKRFSSGVVSLAIDDLNRLWVGTENGLFYFDGIRFTPVQIGNNSGARFINFIEKVKGTIYVGTNNGVYVFDCSGQIPITLKHIGINSGMLNLESNINSSYFDSDFLWFGTAEGLVRIKVPSDPSDFLKSTVPQVSITKMLLNYQKFNYLDYSKKLSSSGIPLNLILPHTKNNISIELDGLLLSDPEAVLFQYWLEGQDASWSPATSNSTLIFTNLPDGDYKLHIRALNELGRFSNEQLIPITITPPFWRRWWFYTLLVVVLLAIIRYYFNWQLKQERARNYKENLENKSRLLALEQQSLNASLNRHFIFNSLNSIQYFINTQDRVSANRYLTSFAKLIRKNLDTAAEGDNMVSLDQELERLELYLSLESMRFKDRFTYEIKSNDIETEQIIVPAMLLQPFVENSIIHGILPDENRKGLITIVLKIIGQQLEICIDDNGIGIEFSLNKKINFEGDHKSQGMEITSKRINLIRKIWKKDYELIGPFQMLNSDQSIKGTRVLIKIPLDYLEN